MAGVARRSPVLPRGYALAVAWDGRLAVLGRNVALVDSRRWERIWSTHPLLNPSHVAFDAPGARVAVKSTSGRIVVLDAEAGAKIADFANAADGEGCAVHFSPCGRFVVDGSWAGALTVRNAESGRIEERFESRGEMIVSLSPCAHGEAWLTAHQPKAGATRRERPYLTLWRWPLQRVGEFEVAGIEIAYSCALSPDGRRIAVRGRNAARGEPELAMIDVSGRALLRTTEPAGGTSQAIRWSPDGTLLGTAEPTGFVVRSASDLAVRWTFASKYPSDLAFLPDTRCMALGTWERTTLLPWPAELAAGVREPVLDP
jgi:WD40 repeat protein